MDTTKWTQEEKDIACTALAWIVHHVTRANVGDGPWPKNVAPYRHFVAGEFPGKSIYMFAMRQAYAEAMDDEDYIEESRFWASMEAEETNEQH
jgi:hypothetical protein